MRYFIFFLLIGWCLIANAQSDVFHDISLEKILSDNSKWKTSGSLTWKHIYNEPKWRRWGATYTATRKLGIYGINGGLIANYTFDSGIVNYLEARPWLGIKLTNRVVDELYLSDRAP